jgi:predicted secreted hydrolase
MMRARAAAVVASGPIVIGAAGFWLASCTAPEEATRAALSVAEALGGADTAGFARVTGPRAFRFPDDHGAHPEYRTEWWYFTGNVESANGRRFGYQLTLFRNALAASPPDLASEWATNQVWMGHLAVTDVDSRVFHGFERFARGAAGLAGARAAPLHVWLEDWSIAASPDVIAADTAAAGATPDGTFPWRLRAVENGTGIDLLVTPVKPIVLQGEAGYSRKGADTGNASHYYSFTRFATTGSVFIDGTRHAVAGASWLDREWSTSALDDGQVGWDWFALQFDDDTELMYYQLRRENGTADVHSRGTFVTAGGSTRGVPRDDVALDVLATWTSPAGGSYPARWRLRIAELDLDVEILPVIAAQEHDSYVRYWEGAVDVRGTRDGQALAGRGYVELTGYADDALRR